MAYSCDCPPHPIFINYFDSITTEGLEYFCYLSPFYNDSSLISNIIKNHDLSPNNLLWLFHIGQA